MIHKRPVLEKGDRYGAADTRVMWHVPLADRDPYRRYRHREEANAECEGRRSSNYLYRWRMRTIRMIENLGNPEKYITVLKEFDVSEKMLVDLKNPVNNPYRVAGMV